MKRVAYTLLATWLFGVSLTHGEGVIVTKKPGFSDEFAEVTHYQRIQVFPAKIVGVNFEGREFSVFRSRILVQGEFPEIQNSKFLSEGAIEEISEAASLVEEVVKRFETCPDSIKQKGELFQDALSKLNSGKIYFRKTWISKAEYQQILDEYESESESAMRIAESAQKDLNDAQLAAAIAAQKQRISQMREAENEELRKIESEKEERKLRALERERQAAELEAFNKRMAEWKINRSSPPVASSDHFVNGHIDFFLQRTVTRHSENIRVESIFLGKLNSLTVFGFTDPVEIGAINEISIWLFRPAQKSDLSAVVATKDDSVISVDLICSSENGRLSDEFTKGLIPWLSDCIGADIAAWLPIGCAASEIRRRAAESSLKDPFSGSVTSSLGDGKISVAKVEGLFWRKEAFEHMVLLSIW